MGAPIRLGVTGACLFLFGAIFGFWGFHKFLHYQIAKTVQLVKGNEMRDNWSKFPVALEFRVYLFNTTNPEEVTQGGKPRVEEIGPFFFDEWKEKLKLEDDETDDTVSFNQRTTWYFQPSRSNGLTGEEMVTIPHPVLISMVLKVEKEKPSALALLSKSLPALFNYPSNAFLTCKVMDLLFRGIPINCTSTDFGPKAICAMIRQNPDGLKEVDKDIFLFSFFGPKNATMEKLRFTVKRGVNDPKEVGTVVRLNGNTTLSIWAGNPCNTFKGTDSTIFPPFITLDDDIVSYAPDLCRSIAAKYQEPVTYKGISGNRYTATLGDQSTDPDEKCYCAAPDKCLKKGAFDATKCVGAPIILTLPHFYETDESYLAQIDGLHPEREKHEIFMNFEPITGTPLGARKRLQFNLMIHSVARVPSMKSLPDTFIPLFWIEEGLELEQKFIDILEAALFRTMRIVGIGKYFIMIFGIALIGGGILLMYKRKQKNIEPKGSKK